MSAATASSHGRRRALLRADPDDGRPVRLTLRRVKFASSFFVGALMLGVISNAVLMQPSHAPLRVASTTAVPRADADAAASSPGSAPAAHDEAPRPAARSVTQVVDAMPVGSITPPPPAHEKPRAVPASAKPRTHKPDGIAAFLKDGKIH